MRAIIQTKYGSPAVLRLTSLPGPTPKDNEILVRIAASSVTAADSMMRRGIPWFGRLFVGLLKPRFPVPGTGFSGTVDSVGSAVTAYRPGDEVMGESVLGAGTNCEFVCVPEDGVVTHKPTSMSHAEAAPVCDGAVTAYNFVQLLGGVASNKHVLINGAAGSLGSAAVQIAKHAGAHVTGICSTRNVGFVRSIGADDVIDYTQDSPHDHEQQYDIIFDSVGKLDVFSGLRLLTESGCYLSPVLSLSLLAPLLWTRLAGKRRVVFSATGLLPTSERRSMLEAVKALLTRSQLTTVLDRSYALTDIADAHRYVDTGHKRGNVVIIT